ncbi:MAG: SpoIID/LytB domain-containing protein [Actinomycetota bacterium]
MRRLGVMAATAMLLLGLAAPGGAGGPASGSADASYFIVGHGRAHGVGMCMDGVYYMAEDGWSYQDILSYFYTGITFSASDENQPIRVKGRDGQIRVWTMQDYLHHLQEEPDNYPLEELKALYIAARTYTLSCIARNKHTAEGFDICSSGDCCQACDENKDIAAYPNNNAAVDATAGQIMTYSGKPITAAYCGSCGGHTENNEDVWGGSAIPYLRGKPDPYCCRSPRYEWSATYSKAQMEAILNSRSETAVGSLYVLDFDYMRTPGGRVKTAKIVGSDAIKYPSGSLLQSMFGFSNTKFGLVRSNFDEYILVLNPNPQTAIVTFTFMKPDGTCSDAVYEVGANSRFTLKVNDLMQFQEVSTRVVSDLPVVAERAMYFDLAGRYCGGTASEGIPAARPRWYFAEGYTGGSFKTYILVQNPGGEQADLKFTCMLPGGGTVEHIAQAPASSRVSVCLNDIPGLENAEVSTCVESTNGRDIVAERACYFDYQGRDGGHVAPGVSAPALEWHLAEGYTGGLFDTYALVQNPTDEVARIDVSFFKEDGEVIGKSYAVPAHSRFTIHPDEIPGLENAGFSTRLKATNGVPFIAERAVYFDYNGCGLDDGSCGQGVSEPSEQWYFAEGYTGGAFDTWVLIENPEEEAAQVTVTFNTPGGGASVQQYEVRPHSRFTVHVDEVAGLSDAEVSTSVVSANGVKVIAERAVYFVYSDGYCTRDGGHDSVGVNAPANTWYFAEGYTGF